MPIDDASLDSALATLRAEHLQHDELEGSLRRVLDATRTVFDVTGAGLMVVDDNDNLRYVAATDGRSAALEAAQAETGEGPCVESLLTDKVVHTDDVAGDPRWPTLAGAVGGLGVGALLGVPIHVSNTSVGSLNVYADVQRAWKDDEVEALRGFGLVVEELLTQALTARERHVLAAQLDRALSSRVLIDRAVGALMAEHRTDPVSAFNLLRNRARAERRKVTEVADEILVAVQQPDGVLTAPTQGEAPAQQ
ncbi:MAG TPA: GAF and ANTAR domain-containing protein [Acidimicrobiales bacterium]